MSTGEASFYVTGGTLRHDAPSYVERQADKDLLDGLLKGEFCYALTSRQMGKSSLMVRAAQKLREQKIDVIALDLTAIGLNLTPEQWYDGLIARMGGQLRLEEDLEEFWRASRYLSPVQRFFSAVREVVMKQRLGPLVIFVDEIDVVRSLPFSTDEFFAAIRECYNRRSQDAELSRLTFCLLGVATPSDLIRDTRMTPFNIGRRVELNDFTLDEATLLKQGLQIDRQEAERDAEGCATALLRRVFYWTGGHPYLTQRLCQALALELQANGEVTKRQSGHGNGAAQQPVVKPSPKSVDRLCEELFLSVKARERDDNLVFVRERMLRSETDLASLLVLYAQVHRRKEVPANEANPLVSVLRLSGITRPVKGYLQVRNQIYCSVFDRHWVKENMPDAELRRQRAAFIRGVLRTTSLAAVIIAVISLLGIYAAQQARLAKEQAQLAKEQARNAQEKTAESQQRLVRLYVDKGIQLMDKGDVAGSLVWLSEAMRRDQSGPLREQTHRVRLASAWQQCPKLIQLYSHEVQPSSLGFSPDGTKVCALEGYAKPVLIDVFSGRKIEKFLELTNYQPFGVSVSRNSRIFAAMAQDRRTITVWDLFGDKALASVTNDYPIDGFNLSSDGDYLAVLGLGKTEGPLPLFNIQVWNLKNAQLKGPRIVESNDVNSIALSPNGRLLAIATRDTVRVWDPSKAKLIGSIYTNLPPNVYFRQVEFSPDSQRLITIVETPTGQTNSLHVWTFITNAWVSLGLVHDRKVSFATFSPDSRRVVTTSEDKFVRVWEAHTNKLVGPPLAHNRPVQYASFSPDGRWLVTCSYDETARVWEVATGQAVCAPLQHNGNVNFAAFSPDGSRVVTSSEDRTTRIWNILLEQSVVEPQARQEQAHEHLRAQAASEDGRYVLLVNEASAVWLWDTSSSNSLGRPLQNLGDVMNAFFSQSGSHVAIGSRDGTVRVLETPIGRQVCAPLRSTNHPVIGNYMIRWAAFGPHDRELATVANIYEQPSQESPSFRERGELVVWDISTGQPISTMTEDRGSISYALFAPEGRKVFTASGRSASSLWDLTTGKPVPGEPLQSEVVHAAFTQDGSRLATASMDGTARIMDVASGKTIGQPLKHHRAVNFVTFNSDGSLIVTTSEDQTSRVWNAQTGEPVTPPLLHDEPVQRAVFSRDSRWVVTLLNLYAEGSSSGQARVWDVASGEPLTPRLDRPGYLLQALFSVDGDRLILIGDVGTREEVSLRPDSHPADDLVKLAQLQSGRTIDATGGFVPIQLETISNVWQALSLTNRSSGPPAPEMLLAWHKRQATKSEVETNWFAAAFHLDRLIQLEPRQQENYTRRGSAHAESENWEQAAADFDRAIELGAQDYALGYRLALLRLWRGDMDGYRRIVAEQLQRFRSTHDPALAADLAWACALAPSAVVDLALPLKLAERTLAERYASRNLNTFGAVMYRAGQFDSAAQRLSESMQLRSETGNVFDWLFLAMVRESQGQLDQARQWLAKATNWWAHPTLIGTTNELQTLSWPLRLEIQILLREATTTISPNGNPSSALDRPKPIVK